MTCLRSVIAFGLIVGLVFSCKTNSNKKAADPVTTTGGGTPTPTDIPSPVATPAMYDNYKHPLGMHDAAQQPLASVDAMVTTMGKTEDSPTQNGDNPNQSNNCVPVNPGGFLPLRCTPIPRPTRTDIRNLKAAIVLGKALFWDIQAGSDGITACATCHAVSGGDIRRFNTINPGPDDIFASDGVNAIGQLFKPVFIKNDDRVGSAGVKSQKFLNINPDIRIAEEQCAPLEDPIFKHMRQVTGRNSPSNIGVVYFRQLFWDGRANDIFNGNDPFGKTGNAALPAALCENCALASQAVGPAVSPIEMSCAGRPFNGSGSIGAKLLPRRPLAFQKVAPNDSVLGSYASRTGFGLICPSNRPCTYQELVDLAFDPSIAGSKAASNFSRIWGQALQAYQMTLIPDRTPYDAYLDGDKSKLTARQELGFNVFRNKGQCSGCHGGPELSDATVSFFKIRGPVSPNGGDTGFHNIGVRPSAEDLGRAAQGPKGVPFAESDPEKNKGAFKTPMLRNIKLSAPYFHNGEAPTLTDVVEFYNRGGDFPREGQPAIRPLGLTAEEKAALVDFMAYALTDPRVQNNRAPFDHPSLPFPSEVTLKEVGAAGGATVFINKAGRQVPSPDSSN